MIFACVCGGILEVTAAIFLVCGFCISRLLGTCPRNLPCSGPPAQGCCHHKS